MLIELSVHGIVINVVPSSTAHMGGSIKSDLTGADNSPKVQAAMDAIESLILAHAVAGMDVTTPAYIEGIETAVEAVWNFYAEG